MKQYKTIFTTERSERHQQSALNSAPDILEIEILVQPDKATLINHLADAEFFISERRGVIDREIIQSAPNLKLIVRLGTFTHDIDLQAAKDAGVIVCRQPDKGTIRVAEHVVMQMLAIGKRLREMVKIALDADADWGESQRTDENTFAYNWSKRENIDSLWQKTVGILGFGDIGAELALRLIGWGCQILYHKRRQLPETVERELNIIYTDEQKLVAESDYLINLLPYASATEQKINAEYIASMKSGVYLISAGSGSVIDEAALADAVRAGKLAGAALDTFEWEPIQAHNPLLMLALQGYNVVLTPHVAAGTVAANVKERAEIYKHILAYLNDQPLDNRLV
jgi:lactate dehydrogenase-like 2-hydroxyacid dehydrogenase